MNGLWFPQIYLSGSPCTAHGKVPLSLWWPGRDTVASPLCGHRGQASRRWDTDHGRKSQDSSDGRLGLQCSPQPGSDPHPNLGSFHTSLPLPSLLPRIRLSPIKPCPGIFFRSTGTRTASSPSAYKPQQPSSDPPSCATQPRRADCALPPARAKGGAPQGTSAGG